MAVKKMTVDNTHLVFFDVLTGNDVNVYLGHAQLHMAHIDPNKLEYEYDTQGDQLAVFSEVWYGPGKGWQAYIDGKPVDHIRVNYILRGLRVPAGKHTIAFEFKPKSYLLGETISLICSLALLALLGFVIFSAFRKQPETQLA